jgi:RHS repeat-associated protein
LSLTALLGLCLLATSPAFAQEAPIVFDPMPVPVVKVEGIEVAPGEGERAVALTARLSHPAAVEHLAVVWRLAQGAGEGVRLDPKENGAARLTLGPGDGELVVEACVGDGARTAGCKRLTLKSELLAACLDASRWKAIEDREWDEVLCLGRENDALRYVFAKVSSRVNTATGEYLREHADLRVKVAGGELVVRREYRRGRWRWRHVGQDLEPESDTAGRIQALVRQGVRYQAVDKQASGRKARRGAMRKATPPQMVVSIFASAATQHFGEGFRWEAPDGRWETYDREGRLQAFGHRGGLVGALHYQDGRVRAIADRRGAERVHLLYDGSGRLVMVSDGVSRWAGYRWDGDLLQEVEFADGRKRRFRYDDRARLAEVQEPSGARTRITYGPFGRVASVTDGEGHGSRFDYRFDSARGLYWARTTAPDGEVREVWFEKSGEAREVRVNGALLQRLEREGEWLRVVDGAGRVTAKRLDAAGNLLEVVHPDGSRKSWTYDPVLNLPLEQVDETGVVTRWRFDAAGRMAEQVEAAGTPLERVTRWGRDADGNPVRLVRAAGRPEALELTAAYDADGRPIGERDGAGRETSFEWDDAGNMVQVCDGAKVCRRFGYDEVGRPLWEADGLERTHKWVYRRDGTLERTVDPLGRVTRYVHDRQGRPTRMLDAAGGETLLAYDPAGRLVSVTDPDGVMRQWGYDAAGRPSFEDDGAGRIERQYGEEGDFPGCADCGGGTEAPPRRIVYPGLVREFTYDDRGRVAARADLLESERLETRYTYDAAGRLMEITDPSGRVQRRRMDALGRVTAVVDPLGLETRFEYDLLDRLTAVIDAKGQRHTFGYDGGGDLLWERRPMGQTTRFRYDKAGRLAERVSPAGRTTRLTYDHAGRLIRATYAETPEQSPPARTVTFTYDAAGNLVGYGDGEMEARVGFDALNRRITESNLYGDLEFATAYGYTPAGRLQSVTGADGLATTFSYDTAGRLSAVAIPGAGTIGFGAYQWRRPTEIRWPNGVSRRLAYDALMRVTAITDQAPGGRILMDYRYTYDRMGRITEKATEHGPYRYVYDALDRLIAAYAPQGAEAFTYDAVGNRVISNEAPDWAYNANNELLAYDGVHFTYDADGNTVARSEPGGSTRYQYNPEGRLSRVEDGKGNLIATYAYDPFGRRIWKEVAGKRTYFIYTDQGLAAEADAKGKITKTYGWKPGNPWSTDPVFMGEKDRRYFYHNDHLGTPQKVTDTQGRLSWEASYLSFGSADIFSDLSFPNMLRFPGQYYDSESSLHYNFHRYFDTTTQRYLQCDPDGIVNGINSFSYANNPISICDPLGLRNLFDFHYYGRWGGPGYTAGMWTSWDKLSQEQRDFIIKDIADNPNSNYAPTDNQDRCYMHHDICYGEGRRRWSPELGQCDKL